MELLDFKYNRSTRKPPDEEHPLNAFSQYYDISVNSDEEWLFSPLETFHGHVLHHLSKIQHAIHSGKSQEEIKKLRNDFYSMGRMHLEDSKKAVDRLEEFESKPMLSDDPGNMLFQEIRQLLRAEPDHRERRKLIQSKLDSNDTTWLKAAASAPDDIVDKQWLKDIARSWSCGKNPELLMADGDAKTILNRKRKRLGEASAAVVGMLMAAGQDPESSVDWEEHFSCFTPRSEKSQQNAQRKIQMQKDIQRARDRFNDAHDSKVVNL